MAPGKVRKLVSRAKQPAKTVKTVARTLKSKRVRAKIDKIAGRAVSPRRTAEALRRNARSNAIKELCADFTTLNDRARRGGKNISVAEMKNRLRGIVENDWPRKLAGMPQQKKGAFIEAQVERMIQSQIQNPGTSLIGRRVFQKIE